MNNKFLMGFCAATAISLSGCASLGEFSGTDSATLNASAAQSFSQMRQEAQQKGILDTSSSGGKVVFYTGIVNKLNLSDNEIAAVMGHEMTHALEEHAKSKIGAQNLTGLALNLGKAYAGDSIGQFGSAALDLGSQVGVGLPYSRNLETRADYGGLMLMAKSGYNPQAAITLWEKMNKLEGAGGPSFLSTHPSNSQRIGEMRKNLPAAMAVYNNRR